MIKKPVAIIVGLILLLGGLFRCDAFSQETPMPDPSLLPSVGAHCDGHTHYSFEVFGVAEEGYSHDTDDIYKFKRKVKSILGNCYVDGGYIVC